jgi:cytochrome P450
MAPDAIVDHTGKDPVEQILRPFKFDIGRNPNPHLAFGIGEHFCLGSNLARLELEVIFRQLAKRLEYAELAGPVAAAVELRRRYQAHADPL